MKTRLNFATVLAVGIVVSLLSACVLAARGDEGANDKGKSVLADLAKAKDRIGPTYRLAYRFAAGDVLRTKVVHLATVEHAFESTSLADVVGKAGDSKPLCDVKVGGVRVGGGA